MARRDYKSRASRSKGKKPVPVWIWLLTGFVLGALTVGLVCLEYAPAPARDNWIGARPPVPAEVSRRQEQVSPEPARIKPPRFDFYNLLPDQEVLVPDEEIERQVRQTPPAPPRQEPQQRPQEPSPPAATATSGKRYMVQVSSFRNSREAQALKAKLGLLGLRARVNKANIKGSTWYRVQLGPYGSAAAMQDIRKQLASSGYKSLAIALK
ncbi:SPOR domain-containing protein [Thiolapillus sp.]